MTATAMLAVIRGIALVLTAVARIPAALAELLRAGIPLVIAVRDLRNALDGGRQQSDSTDARGRDHGYTATSTRPASRASQRIHAARAGCSNSLSCQGLAQRSVDSTQSRPAPSGTRSLSSGPRVAWGQ